MEPLALGLTLALVGIGGTLAILTAIALIVAALKRLFPMEAAEGAAASSGDPGLVIREDD